MHGDISEQAERNMRKPWKIHR